MGSMTGSELEFKISKGGMEVKKWAYALAVNFSKTSIVGWTARQTYGHQQKANSSTTLVISWKFLIKYIEYSFDYLIIIMNQLRLMHYLVYSMVCSLLDTDIRNLLNSQTPTPPQDNSDRSLITPVG